MSEVETCRNGHPWTPENTKIAAKTGSRVCRQCRRDKDKIRREEYKKPNPSFRHYEQHQPKVKARP